MKQRKVEVEWLDSVSWSGWKHRADAVKLADDDELRHRSIGFVLADNKAGLMICQSVSDYPEGVEAQVSDAMMIPRPAILKVREIR